MEVEDTGVGIPAENLPHIFDRFYRVRNAQTNHVQGLGLGLSFVAWIVEAHGGRIDVASTPGEGSRFTVLLPAIEPGKYRRPSRCRSQLGRPMNRERKRPEWFKPPHDDPACY